MSSLHRASLISPSRVKEDSMSEAEFVQRLEKIMVERKEGRVSDKELVVRVTNLSAEFMNSQA